LRVRQKETKQADGSFLGRDWTFHGLNLGMDCSDYRDAWKWFADGL
jgi:hypothetical protein